LIPIRIHLEDGSIPTVLNVEHALAAFLDAIGSDLAHSFPPEFGSYDRRQVAVTRARLTSKQLEARIGAAASAIEMAIRGKEDAEIAKTIAEAMKAEAEAEKAYADALSEGKKARAEARKADAESRKADAEAEKAYAEAGKTWAEAAGTFAKAILGMTLAFQILIGSVSVQKTAKDIAVALLNPAKAYSEWITPSNGHK
jgi:hypothetical protein